MGRGYQTWTLGTPSGEGFREHSTTDVADVIITWSFDLDKYP